MERNIRHCYYSDWNDNAAAAAAMTAESGSAPWGTQSAGDCQSPDTWTRGQTALTTFGDGGSATPGRGATSKDQIQTTALLGDRCRSSGDAAANSADAGHGCYVVALHDEQSNDVTAASEQCRCMKRALLVIDDNEDVAFDEDVGVALTTSRNAGMAVPTDDCPCPPVPRRGCPDHVDSSSSSLNRKPKMVVKPNCDQTTATPALGRIFDATSGRRLAKHLQTGDALLDRGDNNLVDVDCGTGVPDNTHSLLTAAASNLARPSTLPPRCGRSTAEQSTDSVTSSRRPSDVGDMRTTYAPRLFFADSGGGRAHGNAAVYRVGTHHSGVGRDSENCAIYRPSAATHASYGCGRDQINRQISVSGLAPSGDVDVVRGSEVQRRRCACLSSSDGWICRLIVSTPWICLDLSGSVV